jgi:hypothetical protein
MEGRCLGNILMTNLRYHVWTHNITLFLVSDILRTFKYELGIVNENSVTLNTNVYLSMLVKITRLHV